MKRHSFQLAFTLVEMLVVLAIIGIMAGIAGLGLLPLIQRSRVDNAIADMTTATRYAVYRSRQKNTDITLVLQSDKVIVKQGTTVLQETKLNLAPAITCRTTSCPLPVTMTFAAPFGTNAQDFKVNFSSGSASKTMWVRGPSAVVSVQ